jgi:hypothetical protein
MPRVGRRSFLTSSAIVAGAVSVQGPLQALLGRGRDDDDRRSDSPDYGPLAPVLDETTGLPLLMLPQGFRYLSFGWTRDPLNDGSPTPGAHDGMAAFSGWTGDDDEDEDDRGQWGRIYLVRNHEVGDGPDAFGPASLAYDPQAGGGTTTIEFDIAAADSLARGRASAARSATAPAARRRGDRGLPARKRRLASAAAI